MTNGLSKLTDDELEELERLFKIPEERKKLFDRLMKYTLEGEADPEKVAVGTWPQENPSLSAGLRVHSLWVDDVLMPKSVRMDLATQFDVTGISAGTIDPSGVKSIMDSRYYESNHTHRWKDADDGSGDKVCSVCGIRAMVGKLNMKGVR